MNCAQHPERTATAFCQNCGKALCPECVRTADGLILCEPCLLARYPGAAPASVAGWSAVDAPPVSGFAPVSGAVPPVRPSRAADSPVLAGLLGLIPGVGAMYNGQFIKALIHVVVFIVLIGATEHFDLAGLLVAAWYFYQVFDAAQTASARREGRPLPDPFGILELSRRLGPQGGSVYPRYPSPSAPPPVPGWAPPSTPPSATAYTRVSSAMPPPAPAYTPIFSTPPPVTPPPLSARRGEPVGAIVLIAVGLLLLMSTLGVFDMDWVGRGWPVLILILGFWLLVRRASTPLPGEPLPPRPSRAHRSGRNPLSLRPDPPTTPEQRPYESSEEDQR